MYNQLLGYLSGRLRRHIRTAPACSVLVLCLVLISGCHQTPKYKHILIKDFRSVIDGEAVCFNVGNTAHAPATMAVLERRFPDDISFKIWAEAPLESSLREMMDRRFPDTEYVYGSLEEADPALLAAVEWSDLLLVPSGGGIPGSAARALKQYKSTTGKATGAYAVGGGSAEVVSGLDFCRMRESGALGKAAGYMPASGGLAPETLFDLDLENDTAADDLLRELGLEAGAFVCCMPSLRFTPRWEYFGSRIQPTQVQENAVYEDIDNGILRKIVCHLVRDYGLKVLFCAEQVPELRLCREVMYDRLPEDVQAECAVQTRMWLPDEAMSVYRRSRLMLAIHTQSPLMAVGAGVPAIMFYVDDDGTRPLMFSDLGLGAWTINIDEQFADDRGLEAVRSILDNPSATEKLLQDVRRRIDRSRERAIRASFL